MYLILNHSFLLALEPNTIPVLLLWSYPASMPYILTRILLAMFIHHFSEKTYLLPMLSFPNMGAFKNINDLATVRSGPFHLTT